MSKGKKIASIAFTGAAAVTVVGLRVAPANAATSSWKITPGNSAFTGVNTTNAILNAGGISLACAAGNAKATGAASGNGKTGVPKQLAKINTATFTSCSLLGFKVDAKLEKAIGLTAKSKTTTSGVTKGHIGTGSVTTNAISASITGVGTFACKMTVSGTSIAASYHNTGNTLDVNPGHAATLKIKAVTGCSGLFTAGETAFFAANYKTTPALTVTGG
jgi:hypothetical protein